MGNESIASRRENEAVHQEFRKSADAVFESMVRIEKDPELQDKIRKSGMTLKQFQGRFISLWRVVCCAKEVKDRYDVLRSWLMIYCKAILEMCDCEEKRKLFAKVATDMHLLDNPQQQTSSGSATGMSVF